MPIREMTTSTPEWEAFKGVCREKGIKLYWVAGQMQMSYSNLYNWLRRYPGYPDTPEKRARLAEVLAVAESRIWPDADPVAVRVVDDDGECA